MGTVGDETYHPSRMPEKEEQTEKDERMQERKSE
jgi:hypothetical protein